jgi:molybdate transport system substrate-binding protein
LVKKHKVAVIVVAAVLVLVLAVVGAGLYIANRSDNPVETITQAGRGEEAQTDSNTISIYAPSELSKPLQEITSTFQREAPGTTFQFTLGPSSELSKRIRNGERPSLYIDTADAVNHVPAKASPAAATPAPFGYDGVQLAVKRDNPKQVTGLDGFGSGSAITTGICAPELPCGRAGAQALQRAGVNAAPTIVTSNIDELTDGVKTGRIDAVLALRTDLRRVLTGITNIPIAEASTRVDYQALQLKTGDLGDQFVQWLQGSPSAREILRSAGMLSFYDS